MKCPQSPGQAGCPALLLSDKNYIHVFYQSFGVHSVCLLFLVTVIKILEENNLGRNYDLIWYSMSWSEECGRASWKLVAVRPWGSLLTSPETRREQNSIGSGARLSPSRPAFPTTTQLDPTTSRLHKLLTAAAIWGPSVQNQSIGRAFPIQPVTVCMDKRLL